MGKQASGWMILAALALLVSGCVQFTKGTPITEYKRGTQPILAEATVDGEYALFKTNIGSTTPIGTYALKKGDALGFEKAETGTIIAVAGETKLPVPDGSYVWKRR